MKRIVTSFLAISVALLAPGWQTRAADKKVQRADVPNAVLDAVFRKYRGARLTGFEQGGEGGKVRYEVSVDTGALKMDIELSGEGVIIVEETRMRPGELPKPVKAGLAASRYKDWKISSAGRLVKDERANLPFYELLLQSKAANKSTEMEVVFDRDGQSAEETDKFSKGED